MKIVTTKEDALTFIKRTKEENKKATHNVHAFRVGNPVSWEDSSDDGEPHGTAGTAVLNVLKGMLLTNIAVVVTRIYGGIDLGPGGLMRAYVDCVKRLLEVIGTDEMA